METSSENSSSVEYLRFLRGLVCNLKKWVNLTCMLTNQPSAHMFMFSMCDQTSGSTAGQCEEEPDLHEELLGDPLHPVLVDVQGLGNRKVRRKSFCFLLYCLTT